jgi:hypothetical protein
VRRGTTRDGADNCQEGDDQAWDAIATMRVGDDRVEKVTAQQLRRMFDLTTFDDG